MACPPAADPAVSLFSETLDRTLSPLPQPASQVLCLEGKCAEHQGSQLLLWANSAHPRGDPRTPRVPFCLFPPFAPHPGFGEPSPPAPIRRGGCCTEEVSLHMASSFGRPLLGPADPGPSRQELANPSRHWESCPQAQLSVEKANMGWGHRGGTHLPCCETSRGLISVSGGRGEVDPAPLCCGIWGIWAFPEFQSAPFQAGGMG